MLNELLGATGLERFAAVLSLLAIFLTTRQYIVSWPVEIVSSVLYALVFFRTRLYADTILQGLFVAMSFYGWFKWSRGVAGNSALLVVRHVLKAEVFLVGLFILLFTMSAGWLLSRYTRASLPYADSLCTSMSVGATWLAARKVLENWHLWVITDLIYVGLFISKHLYITAGLYFIFILFAIYGLLSWRKSAEAAETAH